MDGKEEVIPPQEPEDLLALVVFREIPSAYRTQPSWIGV
jgi:hypothetical protein